MSPCTAPGTWAASTFDGLVGQSYRTNKDNLFPEASGLHDQVSDIVARGTFAPTQWLDLTYRTRLDKSSLGDALRRCRSRPSGVDKFRVSGGYIYTNFNPYTFYDQPRRRPPATQFYFPAQRGHPRGRRRKWGDYRFSATCAPRPGDQPDGRRSAADAIYEDECFIFDLRLLPPLYQHQRRQRLDHRAVPVDVQDDRPVRLSRPVEAECPWECPTCRPFAVAPPRPLSWAWQRRPPRSWRFRSPASRPTRRRKPPARIPAAPTPPAAAAQPPLADRSRIAAVVNEAYTQLNEGAAAGHRDVLLFGLLRSCFRCQYRDRRRHA